MGAILKIQSLDIWHDGEGYYINNWFSSGSIEIDNDVPSDYQILDALIDNGYLKPKCHTRVHLDDVCDKSFNVVESVNGRPMYCIELVSNHSD